MDDPVTSEFALQRSFPDLLGLMGLFNLMACSDFVIIDK